MAIRFVAIFIDTIIVGVISSILTAPFFALSLTRLATRAIAFGPGVGLRILTILVVYVLYFTLLEGHDGQTVGKMAVKIKVVKEADGSPTDYGEAAVRTILLVIGACLHTSSGQSSSGHLTRNNVSAIGSHTQLS